MKRLSLYRYLLNPKDWHKDLNYLVWYYNVEVLKEAVK